MGKATGAGRTQTTDITDGEGVGDVQLGRAAMQPPMCVGGGYKNYPKGSGAGNATIGKFSEPGEKAGGNPKMGGGEPPGGPPEKINPTISKQNYAK